MLAAGGLRQLPPYIPVSTAPTRPREKRYNWFRLYHDFCGHRKWRLIAHEVGIGLGNVEAIVLRLLKTASSTRARGSVANFSCREWAVDLGIDAHQVVEVYQALEELGYIDNGYMVEWDERQPDREDPTAAQRQQRKRDRHKEERARIAAQPELPLDVPSHRDSVMNHAQDSDKKKDKSLSMPVAPRSTRTKDPLRQIALPLPPVIVFSNAAASLATAHPTGALRSPPRFEPDPAKPWQGKPASMLTRAELEAYHAYKRKDAADGSGRGLAKTG